MWTPDPFPLREIVTANLPPRWQIRADERWCQLMPPDYPVRAQGWKLHVSATWLSAPMVLHRAAQVLVAHGCAFKFAASMDRVFGLTSKDADRSQAGKLLTAYPRSDDHLRQLAPLLDRATAGLPGPAILSDRPLREGSLVHYRYGGFAGVELLTNDGTFEARLQAPDGTLVEDPRRPWFCPPAWARLPFQGPPGQAAAPPAEPSPVLLAGRFRVRQAIRHSARGGVYRASDQQTGAEVVIKQARAHITGLNPANDARLELRREAAMLAQLAGLAPGEVLSFDHGTNRFLAVDALDGQTFGTWVRRLWEEPRGREPGPEGPPVADALAMAGRLADLVAAVHDRGLVFRDLSSNNVLVLADGSVRLVDAELAARPGQWVATAHTPGFAAPELDLRVPVAPAAGPAADHYALGALLCHLTTGHPPIFTADSPGSASGGRTGSQRIALLLRYACARNPAAHRLAPAILGLTADDPDQRWTAARLREWLPAPGPVAAGAPPGAPRAGLEPELQRRLLADGLAYLATAGDAAAPELLVAGSHRTVKTDPCAVHGGVAGVLAVLVRASELRGDETMRGAVTRLARWLDRRRRVASPLLPGLYFGHAGTAWALYDAARHLDDEALATRALELAGALPVRWPNPDVTYGTAGVGLANLHLWHQTKEPDLLDRVTIAVDYLAEQARHTGGRVHWQVDPDFDSKLAGVAQLGFAHGVAGIGAFLLAAARATGRDDARQLAEQAGNTLAATAERAGGAAYWPNDVAGPDPSDMRYYWCSGASGVGTFLLRLWAATGEARYRELAHEAAVTVRRARWLTGLPACHGLPGNGEFLLDLAAACGEPYRGWAEELAAAIYVRLGVRDGRLLGSDEPDGRIFLDFSSGYAGVTGFLLRLVHGGPRWWMVDPPSPEAA